MKMAGNHVVKSEDAPRAVADEDALPDGERAVVPHQQEVEQSVQDSKKQRENTTVSFRKLNVQSPNSKKRDTQSSSRRPSAVGSVTWSSPVAEQKGAREGEDEDDDGEHQLELLVLVLVGKPVGVTQSRDERECVKRAPGRFRRGLNRSHSLWLFVEKRDVDVS